jgi:uncharacterized protein (UPF0264 family)
MKLLVSVRSAEEALAALDGGADVIDIKEPSRGSLGRADDGTVAAVVNAVNGRRMVSAACGELLEGNASPTRQQGPHHLRYVKWGLAGCARRIDWPRRLLTAAQELPSGCWPVVVAYADWERANAPAPEEVFAFSCTHICGAFLIDTCRKDGMTLMDHLPVTLIAALVQRCKIARLPVALAGSLGATQIKELLPLAPDWFALRGAACRHGERSGAIDVDRVRSLVALISSSKLARHV